MLFKRRVIANAGPFSSKWAPVLLRFFQLFVGDQSEAETLTIDTITEHIRNAGAACEGAPLIALLRRALAKVIATSVAGIRPPDPLVRAVTQLEPTRRAVIVLFCGLSLDLNAVAQITGLDREQAHRICADALKELHQRLSSAESPDEPREAK